MFEVYIGRVGITQVGTHVIASLKEPGAGDLRTMMDWK